MRDIRTFCGAKDKEPVEVVFTVSVNKRLAIFPRAAYDQMIAKLKALATPEAKALVAKFENYREVQETDQQNRVKLPQMQAEAFQLSGEVVVYGSGKYLEMVNKKTWFDQWSKDVEALAGLAGTMNEVF